MVASVTPFTGPGNGSNDSGAEVYLTYLMVISQTDVEVPRRAERQGARSKQGGTAGRTALAAGAGLPGAGDGTNDTRCGLDHADTGVEAIDDIEIISRVKGDAVGRVELGLSGRSTIATISRLRGASNRRDDT